MFAMNAVASAKIDERAAFSDANFLDFSNKYGVIAGCVILHHDAVERCQRVGYDGGTAFHVIVMNAQSTGGVGITLRIGEELGQGFLIFPQNTDTETTAFADMKISLGKVVDADEHQRRPQ